MAQKAIVVTGIDAHINTITMKVNHELNVKYVDDVTGNEFGLTVVVVYSPGDLPVQLKSAATDAILATATAIGFSIVAGDVIYPDFSKGV